MRFLTAFAALATLSAFFGCGSKPAPAPVAASQATTQPVDQLLGRWQGTMQVNEEAVRAAVSADKVEAAMNSLQAMRMQMDFRKDGTLLLIGDNQGKPYQSQASWELVSQEGQKLTLRSVEQGSATGVAPQEKMIDIRFESQDAFTMPLQTEVAELGTFHFTRLR